MSITLIAGAKAGIPINAYPTAREQFEALERAARDHQNYWAGEAVKTIRQLCSGYLKESVYVTKFPHHGGRTQFNVMMPGCVGEVIQRANGEYLLCSLTADTAFMEKQEKQSKPGYYEVKESDEGEPLPSYVSNGQVTKERYPVVVTDRYKTPKKAARNAVPYAKKATNVGFFDGMGMLFTPGDEAIGGYKNIHQAMNAATDPEFREAAVILAKTMADSKGLSGVTWISERGGSGVLTQALFILKQQKIHFGNTQQIYFSAPTTNIEVAESLAQDIGMKFDRNSRSFDKFNFNQFVGSGRIGGSTLVSAWNRYKKDDKHTFLKFGVDVTKEFTGGYSAVKQAEGVAKAVAIVGGAAAATGGSPLIGLGLALVGVAPSVFQSFFPSKYHKIVDKF